LDTVRCDEERTPMSPTLRRRAARAFVALTLGLALVAGLNLTPSVAVAAPGDGLPLASPTATTTTTTTTASPTASPTPTASPAPAVKPADEDQWVNLAMIGGGALIGAVIVFMIIGGIIRHFRKRHQH